MPKVKNLTGPDVIRLYREEWELKMKSLNEGDETLYSKGLTFKQKKSGLEYTFDSYVANGAAAILISPEGNKKNVSIEDLEKYYVPAK